MVYPKSYHVFYDNVEAVGRTITTKRADTPHTQTYATTAAPTADKVVFRYVELDTTTCYTCYGVPSKSHVLHALRLSYGGDLTKKPKALGGHNAGVWRIETDNIHLYENKPFLTYGGKNIGSLSIREEERVVGGDGRIITKRYKEKNELLITLWNANTEEFKDVSNEMLIERIVSMGLGSIKKGPTPQLHSGTDMMNGNKYFVLQNITPDQHDKICNSFDFMDAQSRPLPRMWLNYAGKKRKCFFCGEFHDQGCKLQELARKLERERDEVKSTHKGLPIKTYSDSTMRYARAASLASDIDAMSGATTGNLLNAARIDEDGKRTSNLVFVSGQNELNPNLSPEEFLHVLKTKEQRLLSLANEKKIVLITPPSQNAVSPSQKVKEQVSNECFQALESNDNISVFKNPIQTFDEDGGSHPSPEQTAAILRFIDEKTKEVFGHPYILPSAMECDDILVTKRKYAGVNPLYKYGCGACTDQSRNKWYGVCNVCKDFIRDDDNLSKQVDAFKLAVADVEDAENPALQPTNERKRDITAITTDQSELNATIDGGKRSRRSTILHGK